MTRPLTTFGWTARDDARAARIRAERGDWSGPTTRLLSADEGVSVAEWVERQNWKAQRTPYLATLMENLRPDSPVVRVSYWPAALRKVNGQFAEPPTIPPCEG
ncbi:hypothetical protein SAMN05216360_101387 [Methylobacterium phyllostachyos]|uniref:Uncharacterized protein n=1 Tax=Methylobacterium phyllostachyos TaxID=582672 RepID=A0A1G9RV94_9HYPH|nr:hypothetical protein [Methylobacterium phyllostachyos]SDM26937.1 hypothetical protein SAMN05216360_101387 [Methylobacterium phyllostachyos]